MQSDSCDKVITRYLATLAREPFTYKGKTYQPKPLRVSPLLLRGYTCPPMCGGCCFKFSLDYLPTEQRPPHCKKRLVEINGRSVEIWSDWQERNADTRCIHLNPDNGRCGIYPVRPMTCDFELIRTLQSETGGSNVLTQKLFGRGWSYARVDGGKGALCEMTKVTPETVRDVKRKLKRLEEWADHFGIKTWIPNILFLIDTNRLDRTVVLHPTEEGASFNL